MLMLSIKSTVKVKVRQGEVKNTFSKGNSFGSNFQLLADLTVPMVIFILFFKIRTSLVVVVAVITTISFLTLA